MDVLAKYNPGELRYTSVVYLPCLSSSLIMSLLQNHFHHRGFAATTPVPQSPHRTSSKIREIKTQQKQTAWAWAER